MSQMAILLERSEKRHQCSCETMYKIKTVEAAPSTLCITALRNIVSTNAFNNDEFNM